ncbi:MAG: hypothetical protein Q7T55_14820 [Solirubrobacteraceae bacterium]|nr:hypothetical protein [Solirubrobacteraceae bacterium]
MAAKDGSTIALHRLSQHNAETMRSAVSTPNSSRRRHRFGQRSVLLLATACGLVTTGAPASAASYEILQCNDGAGHAVEVSPGFVTAAATVQPNDRCGAGGRLELSLGPSNTLSPFGSQWQSMGISLDVPASMPNARITKARANVYVSPKTGDPTLSYGDFSIHGETGALSGEGIPAGSWNGIASADKEATAPGAGSRFMRFFVSCYGPCDFQGAPPAMSIGRIAVTINDPTPPVATRPEASGMLDGTVQSGRRTVRFTASDLDSGVNRVELRTAAGGGLTSTTVGQGCSYTRPAPCPATRVEALEFDTAAFPDGVQQLELWTVDGAGNLTKTPLPPFTTKNRPDPPGPITRTKAKVAFKVSSKTPRRGAKVTLSGTVTPMPGSKSRVMIETRTKKGWITAAVVRLRAGGTYTWTHRFGTRGPYKMRARLLGTGDPLVKPGTSNTRTFRVR